MRQPYGQNFLTDTNIARRIVDAAAVSGNDTVIEVGPGKGVLTRLLAQRAGKVIAVEIDPKLADRLTREFQAEPRVTVVRQNFMEYPLPSTDKYTIVANLPYYLSTAIIQKFLPGSNWSAAVIMVQKEVGHRIAARRDTPDYGAFSLVCQYYAEASTEFIVGPDCFFPRPKIDSAVVRLTNRHAPPAPPLFFPLINASFSQRRKTIANALSHYLDQPKGNIVSLLNAADIDPGTRAETLGLEQFAVLTSIAEKDILIYDRVLQKTNSGKIKQNKE